MAELRQLDERALMAAYEVAFSRESTPSQRDLVRRTIAAYLAAAEPRGEERREAKLNYAADFLRNLSHLRCEDDCEGFHDPCAACVVHEALRRLEAALSEPRGAVPVREDGER